MQKTKVQIPTANNQKLSGVILRKNNSIVRSPVVLVLHGWTSSMSRYVERVSPLVEMGYTCVLFDMRGHGETGGNLAQYSAKDHLDDCLAAYDYIVDLKDADIKHVSVYGSSYGGYLAALLSAQRKINNLVLKAPALNPDRIFPLANRAQESKEGSDYRNTHHTKNDNQALQAVAQYKGKLLFIACENDEIIPRQVIDDFRNAITTHYTYKVLKGADHACKNPGTNTVLIEVLADWFRKFVD